VTVFAKNALGVITPENMKHGILECKPKFISQQSQDVVRLFCLKKLVVGVSIE
jgi:hypothetical protein